MPFLAYFRALHIRARYIAGQAQWQNEAHERVKRLETQIRDLADQVEHLETRLDRRQAREKGALGGRPPKNVAEVPYGDKAALRKALGVVPGRPFHHQE